MSRIRVHAGRVEATEHPGEVQLEAIRRGRENFRMRVLHLRAYVTDQCRKEGNWLKLIQDEAKCLRDDMQTLQIFVNMPLIALTWAMDLASFLGVWDGTDGGVKDVIMQDILLLERELAS